MKKRGRLIFIFILFIFLLSNIFAEPLYNKCDIRDNSQCKKDEGNHIVLGLSDITNAHGDLGEYCTGTASLCSSFGNKINCESQIGCSWTWVPNWPFGSYKCLGISPPCPTLDKTTCQAPGHIGCLWGDTKAPKVLCCGFGTGYRECKIDELNTIIRLSSQTNAHAEIKTSTNYNKINDVCYEDLKCSKETSASCPPGSLGILSLSADTNAHIGPFSAYSTKICCSSVTTSFCSLNSVRWIGPEIVSEGYPIGLEVTGSGEECNGDIISFEIKEKDDEEHVVTKQPPTVSFDSSGTKVLSSWKAEWFDTGILGGNPQYSFIAKSSNGNNLESGLLTVKPIEEEECKDKTMCEDYITEESCKADLCDLVLNSNPLPEEISCNEDDGSYCSCGWDGTATGTSDDPKCKFNFFEITDCGNPDEGGCKYGCTLCKDSKTGIDYCNVGAKCLSEEDNPFDNINGTCDPKSKSGLPNGEGCLSTDCEDGDRDTCEDGTFCSLGKCFSFEEPTILGSCIISQSMTKGCDKEPVGVKTITWKGRWTGTEQSGTAYENCIKERTNTISCPTQIQLPFFDYYEMIISFGVIALIYFSLILKRKFLKRKDKK